MTFSRILLIIVFLILWKETSNQQIKRSSQESNKQVSEQIQEDDSDESPSELFKEKLSAADSDETQNRINLSLKRKIDRSPSELHKNELAAAESVETENKLNPIKLSLKKKIDESSSVLPKNKMEAAESVETRIKLKPNNLSLKKKIDTSPSELLKNKSAAADSVETQIDFNPINLNFKKSILPSNNDENQQPQTNTKNKNKSYKFLIKTPLRVKDKLHNDENSNETEKGTHLSSDSVIKMEEKNKTLNNEIEVDHEKNTHDEVENTPNEISEDNDENSQTNDDHESNIKKTNGKLSPETSSMLSNSEKNIASLKKKNEMIKLKQDTKDSQLGQELNKTKEILSKQEESSDILTDLEPDSPLTPDNSTIVDNDTISDHNVKNKTENIEPVGDLTSSSLAETNDTEVDLSHEPQNTNLEKSDLPILKADHIESSEALVPKDSMNNINPETDDTENMQSKPKFRCDTKKFKLKSSKPAFQGLSSGLDNAPTIVINNNNYEEFLEISHGQGLPHNQLNTALNSPYNYENPQEYSQTGYIDNQNTNQYNPNEQRIDQIGESTVVSYNNYYEMPNTNRYNNLCYDYTPKSQKQGLKQAYQWSGCSENQVKEDVKNRIWRKWMNTQYCIYPDSTRNQVQSNRYQY